MHRAVAAVLVALAVAACASSPPPTGDGIPLRAQTIELLDRGGEPYTVGRLAFRGAVEIASSDGRFGGYSALQVSPDGMGLTALSDKGHVLRAQVLHDAAGNLTGLTAARLTPLAGLDGKPLSGTRGHDAEALTSDGDDLIAGFEGPARLWRYRNGELAKVPEPIRLPDAAARLPANGSLETVARIGPGRFLLLAEAAPKPGLPVAWIGGADGWRAVDYARTGRFVPVDAQAMKNGDVIVLERRFSLAGGLASRIVRIPATQLAGDRLAGQELALIEPPYATENFEGLALREGPRGETLLYLIADDNFHPLQRTLLVLLAREG
jgi:hypothetical protein